MQTATAAADLFPQTQIDDPARRRLTPLTNNAYRLLGLSVHAVPTDIHRAASALRRALKLGVSRTPATDIAWLGACPRTETTVRDALSRLADPAGRNRERLFWFCAPEAMPAELSYAALKESIARLQQLPQASAQHDIALLSLAVMLQLDDGLARTDDWLRTYAFWKPVIETGDFWSLLMAAELKGDFEPPATFDEVRRLRAQAWRLVASPVIEIAKDAVVREDFPPARRALAMLTRSALPQTLKDEYESEILGPIEDQFDALLADVFRAYRGEVKTEQTVSERRATCERALFKFDEQIRPALKRVLTLAGTETLISRRIFETAADVLDELADSFATAYEQAARLKTLRRAWRLAPPESAALLLIEEHLRDAGDAQERAGKTEADYARQVANALREPPPPVEMFKDYVRQTQTAKTQRGRREMFVRLAFVLLGLIVANRCLTNMPGSHSTNRLNSLNYNLATPRLKPPPIPDIKITPLVVYITAGDLQSRLKQKTATLIEVGDAANAAGRIPGALLIPEAEIVARAKGFPKHKQIVLYCHCGKQETSARAAGALRADSALNVAVLEGGYQAWLNAGLPTQRGR